MRPKEWLHKNGHIDNPNQRGRLSKDHTALIEQAVSQGEKIDGYAVSDKPDSEAKVERVAHDPNRIADVPEPRRSDTAWQAHAYVNGEKVSIGMRTVCNECGNSLTYCACRSPQVSHLNLDSDVQAMVIFTMKDSPRQKWW